MKVIINECFGGFGFSEKANQLFRERGGDLLDEDFRINPVAIQIVEELGDEVNKKPYSKLKIVEIPDDVDWQIDEYDGVEWVAEKHRRWN